MKEEKLVCACRHVTVGDIVKTVAGGARNFEDVQAMTGVARSCCRCRGYAENVFRAALEESQHQTKTS